VKPLHVVEVVPSYVPGWRYGGPIRSVRGLTAALVRRGTRVSVVTTDRDEDVVLDVDTHRPTVIDGASVHHLAVRGPARLRRSPDFARRFADVAKDADVVHVHGLFNWHSHAALAAARRLGVPTIVSPRGMLMKEPLAARGSLKKSLWLALLERRHLAGLAAVHTTSDLEAHELPDLGFAWPRVHVAPNGVDAPVWKGDAARLRPDVRAALARGPYVLFLGRLNWKKGLDVLQAALAVCDARVRVVIAGPDDGWRAQVLAQRAALGLEQRVDVLDSVDGDERAALLCCARVSVLPSRSENFGNAVAESLAAGVPVVVTREVGASEVVLRHGAGVVVEGEAGALASALARALERLVLDDALHAAAAAGARRALALELGWDGVAHGFEVLHDEIAGRSALTRRKAAARAA
jgi:glycosyltransferase involved in cell wall biosynthesis